MLVMAVAGPIVGLIPMFSEWRRTHVFAWTFQRSTWAPGDELLIAAVFVLTVPIIVSYFAWPVFRGRPTPGSCIMGYQIVYDGENKITALAALKRTLAGVTFLGDRRRSIARIDQWFGTRAVKLK